MNNLRQYNLLANQWWDEESPFRDLLHLNEPRFQFFDAFVGGWAGKRVLDLGCGGGFTAEELARRGAAVVGVDPAAELLDVARNHAEQSSLQVDYRHGTGEQIPADAESFDIVVCVDVLEHVADLPRVLTEVRRVLKPNGLFLYDTINRTPFSFLWMIVALEWISGRIPRGTHDWRMFIKPTELNDLLHRTGFESLQQRGVAIQKIRRTGFNLTPCFKVSETNFSGVYVGAARKPC
jgi:2-polyprenyl-6-hydroxyphenyl methylase/3-demethylubiquinone-9 3-methyltransferase